MSRWVDMRQIALTYSAGTAVQISRGLSCALRGRPDEYTSAVTPYAALALRVQTVEGAARQAASKIARFVWQRGQSAISSVPQLIARCLLGRTRLALGCASHSRGAPQPLGPPWQRTVLPARATAANVSYF